MKPYPTALQLGLALADTARIVRRNVDRQARSIGLSRAQWAVLSRIARNEGLRQVDLAGDMEMEPISVARMVDKLQNAGLVERRPDPADRRAYRLYLLPPAQPMLEKVRKIALGVIEPALAHLEPGQVEALLATLEGVRTKLLKIENEDAGHRKED